MEKKIEDYLNYYIGCDIIPPDGRRGELKGFNEGYVYCGWPTYRYPAMSFLSQVPKLVLRPLSDLNTLPDAEAQEIFEGIEWRFESAFDNILVMTRLVNDLRRRSFDCDGLIEAGLAIEAGKSTGGATF